MVIERAVLAVEQTVFRLVEKKVERKAALSAA